MTISMIALAITSAFGGGGGTGGSPPKGEGVLKKWLDRLADALKRLTGKAVESLSTIVGSVVGAILSFLGKVVGFVAEHTCRGCGIRLVMVLGQAFVVGLVSCLFVMASKLACLVSCLKPALLTFPNTRREDVGTASSRVVFCRPSRFFVQWRCFLRIFIVDF